MNHRGGEPSLTVRTRRALFPCLTIACCTFPKSTSMAGQAAPLIYTLLGGHYLELPHYELRRSLPNVRYVHEEHVDDVLLHTNIHRYDNFLV